MTVRALAPAYACVLDCAARDCLSLAELAHARMKADVTATKQRVEGVRTELAQLTQSVAAQSVTLHATQVGLQASLEDLRAALLDADAPAELHMNTPSGVVTLTDENSARELLGLQVRCGACSVGEPPGVVPNSRARWYTMHASILAHVPRMHADGGDGKQSSCQYAAVREEHSHTGARASLDGRCV